MKGKFRVSTALLMLVAAPVAMANSDVDPDDAKVKLSIGSYIIKRADSGFALNEREFGAGLTIDPQDSLGTDLDKSVLRIDGRYRFTPSHSVHFSWFHVKNQGLKVAETDLGWVDQSGEEYTFEAGTQLATQISYRITKVNYTWTFYHTEKVELFASAGLHVSEFDVAIQAVSTINNSELDASARHVESTIPLPAFGIGVRYNITPKWQWYLRSEFFALDFDEWRGTYTDSQFGIEYMPLKHLGLGLGIGSNNLQVMEKTPDYRFTYSNRLTGVTAQLTTFF